MAICSEFSHSTWRFSSSLCKRLLQGKSSKGFTHMWDPFLSGSGAGNRWWISMMGEDCWETRSLWQIPVTISWLMVMLHQSTKVIYIYVEYIYVYVEYIYIFIYICICTCRIYIYVEYIYMYIHILLIGVLLNSSIIMCFERFAACYCPFCPIGACATPVPFSTCSSCVYTVMSTLD
jgi:hypothetical protein